MRADLESPKWAVVMLAMLVLSDHAVADAGPRQQAAMPQRIDRDTICGPRCVAYLLEHYGLSRTDDLYQAVRATQWPEIREGSTLERLRDYLVERGVAAAGVDLPDGHVLTWDDPVILHLEPVDSGPGHYVVWLPESTADRAVLWTGRLENEVVDSRLLGECMSSTVLLTSSDEIVDVTAASQVSRDHLLYRAGVGVSVVLASMVASVLFAADRKRGWLLGSSAARLRFAAKSDSSAISAADVRTQNDDD